jgi:hypothetical protein
MKGFNQLIIIGSVSSELSGTLSRLEDCDDL